VQNFKLKSVKISFLVTQGIKKTQILHFKCKYPEIYNVKVFELSSTHSYTSVVQVPMGKYAKENNFGSFLLFAIETAVLSVF